MLDDSQRIDNADIAKGAGDTAGAWRIWPGNGVPPGSEDWDWHERTTQVPWTSSRPSLTQCLSSRLAQVAGSRITNRAPPLLRAPLSPCRATCRPGDDSRHRAARREP